MSHTVAENQAIICKHMIKAVKCPHRIAATFTRWAITQCYIEIIFNQDLGKDKSHKSNNSNLHTPKPEVITN